MKVFEKNEEKIRKKQQREKWLGSLILNCIRIWLFMLQTSRSHFFSNLEGFLGMRYCQNLTCFVDFIFCLIRFLTNEWDLGVSQDTICLISSCFLIWHLKAVSQKGNIYYTMNFQEIFQLIEPYLRFQFLKRKNILTNKRGYITLHHVF